MRRSYTFKQFWTWRKNPVWMWVEAAVLTVILLAFCYWTNPHNPLYLREIFPWPWLVSLVIVLQYGLGPALMTAGAILLVALWQNNLGQISMIDLQIYALSGVSLIMVCSLFTSGWARQLSSSEISQKYNEERLSSLSRSFYLLKMSCDYLEQNVIIKPMTIRSALVELQKLNLKGQGVLSSEVAYTFLQLIAQFCQVNIGAIYLYENKQLQKEPFVQMGIMGEFHEEDPLIKKCIETKQIAYVSMEAFENTADYHYQIVAPLTDNHDTLFGLLVVKEMPFWSLNEEMLGVISILVHYFNYNVSLSPDIHDFLKQYPQCNVDFAEQITRLLSLKRKMNLDSALVAFKISKKLRRFNVVEHIKQLHRLLDSYWQVELHGADVVFVLMPFTTSAGINGYFNRVKESIHNNLGISFDNQSIKTRSMQLFVAEPSKVMDYFLKFVEKEEIT